MKDFLHKPVTIDSFFKESLEKLPVPISGCDLQWQMIKKKVNQGPGRLPGANTLIIYVFVATTMLLVLGKKSKVPETPQKQVPAQEIIPEKKEDKKPGTTSIQYQEPKTDGLPGRTLIPASPVFDDSSKSIIIAIRPPDSSKKMAVPESKDSLFIFW